MANGSKYLWPLLFSLILHMGTYIGLSQFPKMRHFTGFEKPLEVEIISEPKSKAPQKQFVTDTETGRVVDLTQDQARFLSQLNRRVKEQTIAIKSGLTKNRSSVEVAQKQPPGEAQKNKPRTKADVSKIFRITSSELNPQRMAGQSRPGSTLEKQFAYGESTLSEYIPNVKQGGFTALNTDQFTFYTYFARINEALRPRWERYVRSFSGSLSDQDLRRVSRSDRITEVEILLDRKGRFLKANIFRQSGVEELDWAAVNSFKDAAPFLNPPKDLVEDGSLIRLRYSFHIEWRSGVLADN